MEKGGRESFLFKTFLTMKKDMIYTICLDPVSGPTPNILTKVDQFSIGRLPHDYYNKSIKYP